MRARPTIANSCILASLTGLLAFACFGVTGSRAQGEVRPPTAILFSLDRPIDASAAPFVLASSRGLFGSEGLAVTTNIASGWADAIARVARGDSDFALVDINVLIRFRDKSGAPPVKAVFVLFNKAPYAIIARKSRGIHSLSDDLLHNLASIIAGNHDLTLDHDWYLNSGSRWHLAGLEVCHSLLSFSCCLRYRPRIKHRSAAF